MRPWSSLAILAVICAARAAAADAAPPSIVYILCDDLGYGDVHALNPLRGRIPTPHLDRLVGESMSFREAHGGSSVCTPTRYGILTGRYAWRTRLQSGVLDGEGRPLIAADRLTVPGLLRQHGYATACVGKWHLGVELPRLDKPVRPGTGWGIDYQGVIRGGPVAVGFDHFFGILASLDMPPFVYVRDDRFAAPATVERTWLRTGAAAADFDATATLQRITDEGIGWLRQQAPAAQQGRPFFLYLALTSPHTPILPAPAWVGKSGLGAYGDFVAQTDDCVGQVLTALDQAGLAAGTMVVFTSDNGCSPHADVAGLERQGHFPSADRRGYKADIWDGGHRIPCLVRWPGMVAAGAVSDQLSCLTDLLATCADLLHVALPPEAGEDSVSMLPALTGTATGPLRETVVHHSIDGRFALRQGNWKLECCPGSGGWATPTDTAARAQGLPPVQLYDVTADPGEMHNVQDAHPEVVERLTALLRACIADGRSTPGPRQRNDVPVELEKVKRPATGE